MYTLPSDPIIPSLCAGDDEQSDWFFEGDCGAGPSVAGLMPGWDSDSSLGLEGERPPSRRTFLQPARPSQRGGDGRTLSLILSLSCCL